MLCSDCLSWVWLSGFLVVSGTGKGGCVNNNLASARAQLIAVIFVPQVTVVHFINTFYFLFFSPSQLWILNPKRLLVRETDEVQCCDDCLKPFDLYQLPAPYWSPWYISYEHYLVYLHLRDLVEGWLNLGLPFPYSVVFVKQTRALNSRLKYTVHIF